MKEPFTKYTANYLTVCSQMICSVLSKWHFHFYVSAHRDFGFFSCVGYLHPKDYKESVKNPILNLGLNNLYHPMAKSLLNNIKIKAIYSFKWRQNIL